MCLVVTLLVGMVLVILLFGMLFVDYKQVNMLLVCLLMAGMLFVAMLLVDMLVCLLLGSKLLLV